MMDKQIKTSLEILSDKINQASLLIERNKLNALAPYELTPQMFAILKILKQSKTKRVTSNSIVDNIGLNRSAISRITQRAQENNLIERIITPGHQSEFILTPQGDALVTKLLSKVESFDYEKIAETKDLNIEKITWEIDKILNILK